MLESATIESFRGIALLTLDDLRHVNIFVGTNGAGKTTVLEALWLISSPGDPGLISSLGMWRDLPGLSLEADDGARTIFGDLDAASAPRFRFRTNLGDHSLSIDALVPGEFVTVSGDGPTGPKGPTGYVDAASRFRGLKYTYQAPHLPPVTAELELISGGFRVKQPELPREGAFYIHARRANSMKETAGVLTELYERKQESLFLEGMQKIDRRIGGFRPGLKGKEPIVLVDVGLPRLLPMNVLGDGFCRVALMTTGLLAAQTKQLIVDEIDSGLHSSVMRGFWQLARDLCRRGERQIFCTTHNDEMLSETLGAFSEARDMLRIFRIDRKSDGTIAAKKYTYESFLLADETGVDIR